MKKFFSAFALLFLASIAFSQKVINDANAEPRNVSSFHAIHISSAFNVMISQGNEETVAVSANEKEYVQHIKTTVENGILKIWFDEKNSWWQKNQKLKAYISVKNLDEIKGSGACNFAIEGQLNASTMKIELTGASDLKGKLNVNGRLDAFLKGASDLNISGSADNLQINANGASDVKAYDFRTNTCNVDAGGASDVHITVDKELSVKLSGASSVSYKGTGTIKDIKTNGASNVSHKL